MQSSPGETSQEELLTQLRQERLIRAYLSQILTREAYERIGNVKFSNYDLFMKVASYLIQMKSEGRISNPLDEETLKKIILKISEVSGKGMGGTGGPGRPGGSGGSITIKRK